jgi:hypothetical protein
MALQSLAGPVFWPNIAGHTNASRDTETSPTLDAAGEYVSCVVRATEAMTISHVMFRTSFIASGSPTLDVRIETVDATTGLPTGTLWATNTNVVTSALSNNVVYVVELTASASIAAGDVFAVKWAYNSGTSVTLTLLRAGPTLNQGFPYFVNNTGTPSKAASSNSLCAALGSGATTFYKVPKLFPASAGGSTSFSTTNGDAWGNRFQVPFRCRCAGLLWVTNGSTGEFSYGIYDDAGTELSSSSTSFDIDQRVTTAPVSWFLYFDNPVILEPATWYRAAAWPVNTTNIGTYKWTVHAAAADAAPYTDFHYTTKATGGAWTDTAVTETLVLDLIIDQLDDGVSAASGGGLKLAGRGGLAG